MRERQPLGAVGIVVRPLAHRHDEAIESTLARHSYEALVDRIEGWPASVVCPVDSLVNLVEFVVHHEDARRGGPSWEPRPEEELAARRRKRSGSSCAGAPGSTAGACTTS